MMKRYGLFVMFLLSGCAGPAHRFTEQEVVLIGRLEHQTKPRLGMCAHWYHTTFRVERMIKGEKLAEEVTLQHPAASADSESLYTVGRAYLLTLDGRWAYDPMRVAVGKAEEICLSCQERAIPVYYGYPMASTWGPANVRGEVEIAGGRSFPLYEDEDGEPYGEGGCISYGMHFDFVCRRCGTGWKRN